MLLGTSSRLVPAIMLVVLFRGMAERHLELEQDSFSDHERLRAVLLEVQNGN